MRVVDALPSVKAKPGGSLKEASLFRSCPFVYSLFSAVSVFASGLVGDVHRVRRSGL